MIIRGLIVFLMMICNHSFAQLRDLDELINKDDAIIQIQDWARNAKNEIEILERDSLKSKEALYNIQVTTRSPMGAIIYHTGGILINEGWIRIYGSGSHKLNRNLPEWNRGKAFQNFGDRSEYLIIGDDAVGGFFFLNGGALGHDLGNVYYLSPDNTAIEPLGLSYTGFIQFCFDGNIDNFYEDLRWKNWENDFKTLNSNEAFVFFPYLWTKEGRNINKVQKNKAPIHEVYESRVQKL